MEPSPDTQDAARPTIDDLHSTNATHQLDITDSTLTNDEVAKEQDTELEVNTKGKGKEAQVAEVEGGENGQGTSGKARRSSRRPVTNGASTPANPSNLPASSSTPADSPETSAPQPSAKALGKRRAISPSPPPPTNGISSAVTPSANKRAKTSHITPSAASPAYNLRSKNPPSTNGTPQSAKLRTSKANMPRKSRSSLAAGDPGSPPADDSPMNIGTAAAAEAGKGKQRAISPPIGGADVEAGSSAAAPSGKKPSGSKAKGKGKNAQAQAGGRTGKSKSKAEKEREKEEERDRDVELSPEAKEAKEKSRAKGKGKAGKAGAGAVTGSSTTKPKAKPRTAKSSKGALVPDAMDVDPAAEPHATGSGEAPAGDDDAMDVDDADVVLGDSEINLVLDLGGGGDMDDDDEEEDDEDEDEEVELEIGEDDENDEGGEGEDMEEGYSDEDGDLIDDEELAAEQRAVQEAIRAVAGLTPTSAAATSVGPAVPGAFAASAAGRATNPSAPSTMGRPAGARSSLRDSLLDSTGGFDPYDGGLSSLRAGFGIVASLNGRIRGLLKDIKGEVVDPPPPTASSRRRGRGAAAAAPPLPTTKPKVDQRKRRLALQELSEVLLMCGDDSMQGYLDADPLARTLVDVLRGDKPKGDGDERVKVEDDEEEEEQEQEQEQEHEDDGDGEGGEAQEEVEQPAVGQEGTAEAEAEPEPEPEQDEDQEDLGGGYDDMADDGDMDPDMLLALRLSRGEDVDMLGTGGGPSNGFGMGGEDDVENMVLACRCLANLMESVQGSAHSIVYAGAVPVLCDKLLEIQFIDLAEQVLSTLEKISLELPSQIVKEGGLAALLNYLDFFSTSVQRTAVTAAANCCRHLSVESFSMVRDAMPTLRNVLGYPDARVVEQACIAVVRVTESYKYHPDKLDALLTPDLLRSVQGLLTTGTGGGVLSEATHTSVLRMLAISARASAEISIALVEMGVGKTIYQLLTGTAPKEEMISAAESGDDGQKAAQGEAMEMQADDAETGAASITAATGSGDQGDMFVLQNLVHRPTEQVLEALTLIVELLPPLPKDGIFDLRQYVNGSKDKSSRSPSKVRVKREEASPALNLTAAGTGVGQVDAFGSGPNGQPARDMDTPAPMIKSEPDSTPALPVPTAAAINGGEPEPSTSSARSTTLPGVAAGFLSRAGGLSSSLPSSASKTRERAAAKEAAIERRVELFSTESDPHRKDIRGFYRLLLPVLVDVYAASVNAQVRTRAMTALLKIIYFSNEVDLPTIVRGVPLGTFLASLLASKDIGLPVTEALQMIELLLARLPDVFHYRFRREGVLREIERAASEPLFVPLVKEREKAAKAARNAAAAAAGQPPVASLDASAVNSGDATPTIDQEVTPATGSGMDIGTRVFLPNQAQAGPSALTRALRQHQASASSGAVASSSSSTAISTETASAAAASLRASQPDASSAGVSATDFSITEAISRDSITNRAAHIVKVFAAHRDDLVARTESVLQEIKGMVAEMDKILEESEAGETGGKVTDAERERVRSVLLQVAHLLDERGLGKDEVITSFEMLESGLVDGLLRFTTEGAGVKLEARRQILSELFLSDETTEIKGNPFAALVRRLQDSLSRIESFDVLTASSPGGGYDGSSRRSGSSSTSLLARQLRLKLVADSPDIPRSCSNFVVSIHAIATFQAFHDYLRPRIIAATPRESLAASAPSGSGGGGLRFSQMLAALAAANGHPGDSSPSSLRSELARLSSSLDSVGGLLGNGRLLGDEFGDAASPTAAGSSSSNVKKGKSSTPRRRSSRLAKTTTAADAEAEAEAEAEGEPRAETEAAEAGPSGTTKKGGAPVDDDAGPAPFDEDEAMFAGDFDEPTPSKEDPPVTLDPVPGGNKLVAHTPGGTRVATPTMSQNQSFPATSAKAAPSPSRTSSSGASRATKSSYAAAVKADPTDWHLEFFLADHPVPNEMTIYGAVATFEAKNLPPGRDLWSQVFTLKYRKVSGPASSPSLRSSPEPITEELSVPESVPAGTQSSILQLLRVLHALNMDWRETRGASKSLAGMSNSLPEASFVNNKLSAKLNRQLEEPMIVASACLPDWALELPHSFPFLFPFETRYSFLQATSFGYARLMNKWLSQAPRGDSRREENLGHLGRLQRQKVRISRDRILESAFKVFELYGASRSVLEVEYFDEVGTGLGPTLEFFRLISTELCRRDLGMWRDSGDGDGAHVDTASGLFPQAFEDGHATAETGQKRLGMFRLLGSFLARSIMDSRLVSFHFSKTFMKLVLGRDVPLTSAAVANVDPFLGQSLRHLESYEVKRAEIEHDRSKTDEEKNNEVATLIATVDDLGLEFTYPGLEFPLKPGGESLSVSLENVEEYVRLVADYTIGKGVREQVRSFKEGFTKVFPTRDLHVMQPVELVDLFGEEDQTCWTKQALADAIKADHGFTAESPAISDFIEIMSDFDQPSQRLFLSFVTGSARLPIGGFKALRPPLTVVRKMPEPSHEPDEFLPSVMTCQNFVKLPQYSTKEVMRQRVVTAMTEGAGSFHLS